MKKIISVMLAALMLASTMSATVISAAAEEVAQPVYVVAGSEELCGVKWNGNPAEATDNIMTFSDDVYTKVFTDVAVADNYEIKVVENPVGGPQNWIGDATGNNVVFNVVDVCDVTVTYNPATGEVAVTGDSVTFPEGLVVDAMYAVGAGDGAWMNGIGWDPAAEVNMMTEVADNVYEITFTGVEGPFDGYQGKFAANAAWTHSWGGVCTESGVAFDAVYNGDNIFVNVPYELADVTLTLDLTAFDYATKTGAKATITVVDMTETEPTEEPTEETTVAEDTTVATEPTEETTVAEDTTVETEPTEETTVAEDTTVETEPTEETTVAEDTTVATEPTEETTVAEDTTVATEPTEETTVAEDTTVATDPVADDVYVVAGVEALCGVNWKGNAEEAPENVMVEADGVYTKVFTDVQPADGLQFKVVKNNTDWIGDETGNNVTFNVTTACDVTVTYDAATGKITVSGEGVELVKDLEYENVFAVGAGDGAWLNDVAWDPAAEVNKMAEVADKVYEITFEGVEEFSDYQVKFALDGEWTHNWGGTFVASGEAFDAVYNAQDNIIVNVPYAVANVTLTLDLSAFDYATKTGAKITITVVEVKEVEVVVGDADGNGELDVDDVTFLQMSLAGYEGYEVATEVADVNADGVVDVEDVTAVQFILAGIEA